MSTGGLRSWPGAAESRKDHNTNVSHYELIFRAEMSRKRYGKSLIRLAMTDLAMTDRAFPLSTVGVGQKVVVKEVCSGISGIEGGDIGLRLAELGFVAGEPLRVVAQGYPGREPIAVRIGNTTFALRRFEADHVLVAPAAEIGIQS